jgi:hypothetical protein
VAFQRKKPAAIGVKAPFPGFVEPALASSIDKVPSGTRWIHEIKFDGYRVQVHLVNEAVKVFTRRGHDWTRRFRKIADEAWHIAAGSAILDGGVVAPAEDGTTDFSVLQNELRGKSKKIVLVAFDLLYLNGYDLRKLPLIERKAHLKKLVDGTDVQFSESFEVDGPDMYAHACKVGLEGVVSKVRYLGMTSNALQNFHPERSVGGQSADHGADLADPETGGAAPEPQRVLVGQAAPRRRWPALRQVGRRGPLRGVLSPAVDEGPAAHLDQRMIQGVKDNKYQECVRANILAPCLLGAQYRPSLYINIHQQDTV